MVHQVNSAEVWGQAHNQSGLHPAVKAFYGPLPVGLDGIEFETSLPPTSGRPVQGVVHAWYASSNHAGLVPGNSAFAFIPVLIRHVRYMGPLELQRGVDVAL